MKDIKRAILLILLLAAIFSSLFKNPIPQVKADSNWLTGWNYRKTLTINNTSSEELKFYVGELTIDTVSLIAAGKMLFNAKDVRFTTADGTTEIPFWIKSGWNTASTKIMVQTPSISASSTTDIYFYYGNDEASYSTIPPLGSFPNSPNYVISTTELFAENIVFDSATNKYWWIFSDRLDTYHYGIRLASASDIDGAWTLEPSYLIFEAGYESDNPHLVKFDNYWYVYYERWAIGDEWAGGSRLWCQRSTTVNSGYSTGGISNPILSPTGVPDDWDEHRVCEPFVFKEGSIYYLFFMGGRKEGAILHEKVGYATSTSPTGSFTKYSGNPVMTGGSGLSGVWNNGGASSDICVADPSVIKYKDRFYIIYSSIGDDGFCREGIVWTDDFTSFIEYDGNPILGLGKSGNWDENRPFRGAIMEFGDYYYFAYAGRTSGMVTRNGITKVSRFADSKGYPPEQVYILYEDFESYSVGETVITTNKGYNEWKELVAGFTVQLNGTNKILMRTTHSVDAKIVVKEPIPQNKCIEFTFEHTLETLKVAGGLLDVQNDSYLYMTMMGYNDNLTIYERIDDAWIQRAYTAHTFDVNETYRCLFGRTGDKLIVKSDGISLEWTDPSPFIRSKSGLRQGGGEETEVTLFDDISIRRFTSPEPTWTTWGSEETEYPTYTMMFYSSSNDGHIYKDSLAYSAAWGATSGIINDGSTTFTVGQHRASYQIYRGYTFFDTNLIPDGVTITSVQLSLYLYQDDSDVDFSVTVQNGQPIYPHQPLQAEDYLQSHYSGNGGTLATSLFDVGGGGGGSAYYNLTFNSEGRSWINDVGTTKLCLRSSRDISESPPSIGVDETVIFYAREKGENYAPRLYVTYLSVGYSYILHGAYNEQGFRDGAINVTFYKTTENPETFLLDGTENKSVAEMPIAFHFDLGNNQSRTYYIKDSFEEIYVFRPSEPFFSYYFSIVDFVGITNGYLESLINANGTDRVVERWGLAILNDIPFTLSWGVVYKVRLVCDQGIYYFGEYLAGATTEFTLVVTRIEFPEDSTHIGNITLSCMRMNSTWISVNYFDAAYETSWVDVTIYEYRMSFVSYSTNSTGSTHQVNWYSALSSYDYSVVVTASHQTRGTLTWSRSLPSPQDRDNPWDFEWVGTFPIDSSQIIGMVLVCFFFAVFTQKSAPVGVIVAVLMAMFFTWMGWLDIGWTWLITTLGIAFIVALSMGRKRSEAPV